MMIAIFCLVFFSANDQNRRFGFAIFAQLLSQVMQSIHKREKDDNSFVENGQ